MIEDQRRAIIGFRSTGERSAESAASEFLRQPGLRVLETFKSRSDDLPAFGAIADAQSQTGQIVRMLVYFIEHRGHVYEFIAYSAPQSFGHFQNEFLRVMRGFGEVNDRDIWRREPVRLDVERASRSAPFGSFIPAELPNDMRPEELAILNQVALEEQIERGKLLKLPSRR